MTINSPFKQLLFCCITLFIALSFACGGGADSGTGKGKAQDRLRKADKGNAYYGGIIRVNEDEHFRSLYPLNISEVVGHRIVNQVYEGLLKLDQKDLTLQPCLAESWEANEDATIYTFNLRKDARFHDNACFPDGKGRAVTAQDFAYSFKKLCTPAGDNKGFSFVVDRIKGARAHYDGKSTDIPGISVIGDHTLRIELNEPFGIFPYILAMPFCAVFPKEAIEKYGVDMRANMVGTGPFKQKTVKDGKVVALSRNDQYWAKDKDGNSLPYLDGVRVSFIKDQMSSLLELKQGNLDFIYRLPLQAADEITDRDGNLLGEYKEAGYQYQDLISMTIQYYGFLNNGKLFNNKKLRQAFCYAVDRDRLVDLVLKGSGVPGHFGMVPPAFANYEHKKVEGYKFDPDKARKLLAEAGHPEGKGLDEITLQINSGGTRNEQVAEAVQKMLNENLNVKVRIQKMPWPQHTESLETGKVDFWRLGWVADYPDPENFLNYLWSKHLPAGPKDPAYINALRFNNAEFDKTFEQALRTVDEAERNALYLKADQIALEEAPFLPLFYDKDERLLNGKLRNFPQNPMEYRLFTDVYFVP